MIKKTLSVLLTLLFSLAPAAAQTRAPAARPFDAARHVNPFVGTANSPLPDYLGGNASGNTFPGATVPFGMVQFSPDTERGFGPEDRGSYVHRDTAIRGFSLTHLSGPGCPIFGDVPVMPFAGRVGKSPAASPADYVAKFSHDKENASPGFYEVALESGVRVRLTATTRTGFAAFDFPAGSPATLLTNVGRNATGVQEAEWRAEGDRRMSGSVASGAFCGTRNRYVLHFAAEFDRPFDSFGSWDGERVLPGVSPARGGRQTGGFVTFDAGGAVRMKVGLSYVSVEKARANLRAENAGWDFDGVRDRALARWNDALGRVLVRGGTDEETRLFYTALYHTLLHPTVFGDADGEYMGFDDRPHKAPGHTQYTNFSGWDIYRSHSPLVAWLFPEEASDMARSLVNMAEQGGGGLPKWPVANDESGAMYGDPAVPIIAGTYAFGARDFDPRAALKVMLHGATDPEARSKTYLVRPGLADFLKYGYIPMEQKGLRGSPSVALEYETADFALAQFARAHGDRKTHAEMMRRAQLWTRLFDPETRYIRGRWADGSWLPGFDFKAMLYRPELPWRPESHKSYVEGNATQYTWMIPHNLRAVIDRIGGNEAAARRLDGFFAELNAGPDRPHFFIGNEPVLPVPWVYNYVGEPWKTQAVTRRVLTELFTPTPGGLPGNDDLGATSSWVVFASIGLYPIIPGVGGFSVNSPLFPEIDVRLKGGSILLIKGRGAGAKSPYVQELRLNGRPHESTWVPYESITRGGVLDFTLGPEPNKKWATAADAAPPSFNEGMEKDSGASR